MALSPLGSCLAIFGAEYRIGLLHLGIDEIQLEGERSKMHLRVKSRRQTIICGLRFEL
jgi:hypothetical protein